MLFTISLQLVSCSEVIQQRFFKEIRTVDCAKMQPILSFTILLALMQSVTVDAFSINAIMGPCNNISKLAVYANRDDQVNDVKTSEQKGFFGEFFDIFKNLDDVAEDFFYKRMGKGEIFYGKRKYKPSGDVEGEYNGFGLSDKLKIDMTREYKEAWLEEKRMRDEIKMIKEEKERRDASR